MPKQPAGITKSKRIECLRQVMKRWGRLSKKQIDAHLAAQLGVDEKHLARALYRDLEELVNNSELLVDHYSRDGEKLEEYDPETNRNIVAEWYYPGHEGQVIGHAALSKAGGEFSSPRILLRDFKIGSPKTSPDFNAIHIYFSFLQSSFCLSVNLDVLPVSIVVGRILPSTSSKIPIEEIREIFGKRAAILLTPVPNMTASRNINEPGHFIVEMKEPGQISVRDLGSTNGTRCLKLTPDEADLLRKKSSLLGDSTITSSWANTPQLKRELISVGEDSHQDFHLPLLVEASDKFRMMII